MSRKKHIVCKDHTGKEISAYVPEGYEHIAVQILASPLRPTNEDEFFVRVFKRQSDDGKSQIDFEVQIIDGRCIPTITTEYL